MVGHRRENWYDRNWLNVEKQANKLPGYLAIERKYSKDLQFIAQKL
jgi:hypothetical protein